MKKTVLVAILLLTLMLFASACKKSSQEVVSDVESNMSSITSSANGQVSSVISDVGSGASSIVSGTESAISSVVQ